MLVERKTLIIIRELKRMTKKGRITIKELSKTLGVSVTTITNALTGQPNVSEKKRIEIINTAKKLGYKPNLHARGMVKNGIKIGIVLAGEPWEFTYYIRRGIMNAVEKYSDFKVSISEHPFHDNRATLEVRNALLETFEDGVDGLFLSQSFFPDVYQNMLKEYIDQKKMPMVQLNYNPIFKNAPDIARISTNPKVTGKMVAQLLRIALGENGVIGVITTSKQYDEHRKIVETFSQQCDIEGLRIVSVMENNDNRTRTYDCTRELLRQFPEIQAIYITSFDSIPVCKCVESMNLKEKILVVGHDVYPDMVKYLQDGSLFASIFQDPIMIGEKGIEFLINCILGDRQECREILTQPQLVLSSNLECYEEYIYGKI